MIAGKPVNMKRVYLAIIAIACALVVAPMVLPAHAAPQVNASPDVSVSAKKVSVATAQVWVSAVDSATAEFEDAIPADEKIIGRYSLIVTDGSKFLQDKFGTVRISFKAFAGYKSVRVYHLPADGKAAASKWLAPKDGVKVNVKSSKFMGPLANIIVTAKADDAGDSAGVAVRGVYIGAKETSLIEGNKLALLANFAPSNATAKSVTWKSSDKNIASISKDGVVTAVKPGSATITATSDNGKTSRIKIVVTAKPVAPSSSSGSSFTPSYGGSSYSDDDYYDSDDYGDSDDFDGTDDLDDTEDPEDPDGAEDPDDSEDPDEGDEGDEATAGEDPDDSTSGSDGSALGKYSQPSASDYVSSKGTNVVPIVIGIVVVLVLVGAGVGYYLWRKKKSDPDATKNIFIKRH